MPTNSLPSFSKILDRVDHGRQRSEVFPAFVKLAACALAMQTRETEYLEEAKRWRAEDLRLFGDALGALIMEMEGEPFTDLLGPVHMDTLGTNAQQCGGEFHTPQPIAELMARMTMGEVPEGDEQIDLCEPACGSGVMILASAGAMPREAVRRLRVVAIDISRVACDMCFINTTLWGIPCVVVHGNALSCETWAQWRNVHHILPFLWRFAGAGIGAPAAPTPADVETLQAVAPAQGTPPAPELAAQIDAQLELVIFVQESPAA